MKLKDRCGSGIKQIKSERWWYRNGIINAHISSYRLGLWLVSQTVRLNTRVLIVDTVPKPKSPGTCDAPLSIPRIWFDEAADWGGCWDGPLSHGPEAHLKPCSQVLLMNPHCVISQNYGIISHITTHILWDYYINIYNHIITEINL